MRLSACRKANGTKSPRSPRRATTPPAAAPTVTPPARSTAVTPPARSTVIQQSPRSTPDEGEVYRRSQLEKVFRAFDIDGGGGIGADELFELGTARRRLGHKGGAWTVEQNERTIAKMKNGRPGEVECAEFVRFFDETLP